MASSKSLGQEICQAFAVAERDGQVLSPLGFGELVVLELERAQLKDAYRQLDELRQRMPFHAGEIHLVNLTALFYSEFDFRRSLEFVVNYGRDNDATAAVTGALLGAYVGAEALPERWVHTTLERNRAIGLDLEDLTDRLLAAIERRR